MNAINHVFMMAFLYLFCTNILAQGIVREETKPQNDVGFIIGLGFQGNGELQDRLEGFYSSEGWSGSGVPSIWVGLDLGLQIRTIHQLYVTPGVKTLYSSVKKTIVWEDLHYSQDASDTNFMFMPSVAIKYIIFHKGLHSFTINGMISKPKWVSGPEDFSVDSNALEKGLFLGYELGNPISKTKRAGYAKAVDRSSTHLVLEAGFSSIPMTVNSVNCDMGGAFLNLKGYFGFMDWK